MEFDLAGFKARNKGEVFTRECIVAEVARATGITKVLLRQAVAQVFLTVLDALVAGKRVEIRGFGTFGTVRVSSRRRFVPTKGKVIRCDANWKLTFRGSRTLKAELMRALEA